VAVSKKPPKGSGPGHEQPEVDAPPPKGPTSRRFTKPMRAVFLKALSSGVTRAAAAVVAGTTYRTIIRWLEKSERFRQQVDDSEQLAISKAEAKVAKLALVDESLPALKYYLNNRAPDRWKTERRLQIEQIGGAPAGVGYRALLRNMPEELAEQVMRFLLSQREQPALTSGDGEIVDAEVEEDAGHVVDEGDGEEGGGEETA
jgi:hypothetical protein